jgi:F-type H+-transporting ATPase subunit b
MKMSITRATFGASAALSAALLALTSTAHAAEGGGGSLPQLDVATYPSQLFWLLVSFVALYLLLSKVALPRVSEVLESRQERIDNDLAKAQQLRDEAATVQAAYEASLAESRTEAQGVVSAANADIAARLAASEEEAARKSAEALQAAETRIAEASAAALDNIRDVAAEVAGQAVTKLIGVDVAAASVNAAVDQAMGDGD